MLHRNTLVIEEAIYCTSEIEAYRNNPLIEALPPLLPFAELATALEHFPDMPSAASREQNEWQRFDAVGKLREIIIASPEFKKASIQLHNLLRRTYVARNCTNKSEEIRCIAIANRKPGADLELPVDWKSTASGHMFISSTGTGKTTFIDAFLLGIPQLIRHKQYQGEEFMRAQVVYLKISIPPDGTLKAFCLSFFQAVDKLLRTNYLKQAYAAETVAKMTLLMGKVATSISLGFLIVDEFQNLKIAKTEQCVIVFNMFVQIIEDYGISVVTLCTPSIRKLLGEKIAITRKITGTTTHFRLMAPRSNEWQHFTTAVWPFSYTLVASNLTQAVSDAWYKASGGNAAFAIQAYKLAQEDAIMNDSTVDETSFEMVLNDSFAALKPAIDALVRGIPTELDAYEDLISDTENRALVAAFMPHAVHAAHATMSADPTGSSAPARAPVDQNAQTVEETGEFEEMSEARKAKRTKLTVGTTPSTQKTKRTRSEFGPLPTRPVVKDLA